MSEGKEPRKGVLCVVCQVEIPTGEQSKELHETGQKHIRMRAQLEAVEALARRSVFIKVSPEKETTGHIDLDQEVVKREMAKFGAVARVLCRVESAHFAIVEFKEEQAAHAALKAGTVVMEGVLVDEEQTSRVPVTVLINKRNVNFSKHSILDKVRINVDEIVEGFSHLEVPPESDSYSVAIDHVIDKIVLPESALSYRHRCAERIQAEFAKFFVAPTVKVFGSSITSIGTIDSDVDMCLFLADPPSSRLFMGQHRDKYTLLTCDAAVFRTRKVHGSEIRRLTPADQVRFVSKIVNEIRKEVGFIGVQRPVIDCRLPILRFLVDKQIAVDLSVDNALGVAKSEYIRELIQKDASGILRRMLIGLRFWALSNGLFQPPQNEHKGHFNAYMLNILAVSFLKSLGHIPPLQFSKTAEYGGSDWRIDFVVPEYSLEGKMTVQEFFRQLFIFLTSSVNLKDSVFVGGSGDRLSVADFRARFPAVLESTPTRFVFGNMNIQDPIEQAHNVGATLSEKMTRRMRHMMMRSLHAIKTNGNGYVHMLSVEKQLARPSSSTGQADVAQAADASLCLSYPPSRPSMVDAMRATMAILEKILLVDDGVAGPNKKRRRMDDESAVPEADSEDAFETAGLRCTSFHWGTVSVPGRLWIGRRNVKRRIANKHPEMSEADVDGLVSAELAEGLTDLPVLTLQLDFVFDEEAMHLNFKRLEGTQLDLSNMVHYLDTNGLLSKYVVQQLDVSSNTVSSLNTRRLSTEAMEAD